MIYLGLSISPPTLINQLCAEIFSVKPYVLMVKNREGKMKTLFPLALMIIALLVAPAVGGDETIPQRAFYEGAIDEEISQCRQLASLLTSRSAKLRMKGHVS